MAVTLHDIFRAIHATLQEQARLETESVEALLFDATLDRTDAARKTIAGLPSLEEVEAYELEQEAIASDKANQGDLF